MSEIHLLITIAERSRLPAFVSLYQEASLDVNFIMLGNGTASDETLGLFGLDKTEKAVCFSVVTSDTWRRVKHDLEHRIRIDVPGTGVAFTVPLSSIGGKRELMFLLDGQEFEIKGESEMQNTDHELLVIICNQGYNELVMDAARSGGAAGGTVIHARGTGMHKAEKFLGISLASEKDIIFVVAKTSVKNDIMSAVMKNAGVETKAKAIVFSLPVTDVAGFKLLEE